MKNEKIGQFWFLKEHKSVKVGLIHWFNHRATSWPPFDPPELLNIQFTSISSIFSFNPKFEHFWNYPSVQWAQKPNFFLKITVYFQSPKIRGNLGARASMLFFFKFSAGSTSYESSPNDRFFFSRKWCNINHSRIPRNQPPLNWYTSLTYSGFKLGTIPSNPVFVFLLRFRFQKIFQISTYP